MMQCQHCNGEYDITSYHWAGPCPARAERPYFEAVTPGPECECGARALGIKDHTHGHASYCPVRVKDGVP